MFVHEKQAEIVFEMKQSIFILLLAVAVFTSAATPYKVRYITADDGLSRNLVHQIFKDSRGFIWIATAKGLDRYDGYNLLQYNSTQRDTHLQSDFVNCVEEDNAGNLWIGTDNGLFFLDYQTGVVSEAASLFRMDKNNLKQRFHIIRKDENNRLWLGHSQGISLLSVNNAGSFVLEEVYKSENVADIMLLNGSIFIAEDNQVFRLIKGSAPLYSRLRGDEKLRNLAGAVNVLFHDAGNLWIGTATGLYRYELSSENLRHYTHNMNDEESLSSNAVTDIARSNEGQILVGTLIGLNIFDYQTNQFRRITSDQGYVGEKLNNNFVSSIYADNNIIWVGTEKGGVNMLFPDQQFFSNLKHQPGVQGSLSNNPVNAIYEDDEGDLWVGIVEGGLNFRKKGSKEFRHFISEPGNASSLSHNSISAITQDHEGNYWFGTWGMGLNFMKKKHKNNPVFERFIDTGSTPGRIISNFVAALAPDKQNNGMWVGTRAGLDFVDLKTRSFRHILSSLPNAKALRLITGMTIDESGRLWVGTGNGLFCIDLSKSDLAKNEINYRHFHFELSNPESGIIEKINCILQTRDGRLWFGSNGNGLYLLDEQQGKPVFTKYDVSNGLLDNVIYGMLEDDAGNIWMSTDKGLCAFNPGANHFRSFTIVDGLASNQFYWDAYFRGSDGKMYFGHMSGLTIFDPLKYIPPMIKNTVAITRIAVLNENVLPANRKNAADYLRFESNFLKKLILRESDKTFSVEFSALSYFLPDKIKYAYRLRGFDNAWKEVTADRRFANFTNIKHGKYYFDVKCTNADGSWSDLITSFEIRVIPPFYKTWWFLGLFMLLTGYGAYNIFTYRIRSLKKQEVHLKQLVAERTREIEEQKEKVQEATLDKIAFFTNITHEFRTPVTLILGPVERALKLSTNPKVLEQLNIVSRNSRLLLSLINQLMDFRKVDAGKMQLSMTKQNFNDFLDDIILPFEDMGKDRGIVFRKQFRMHVPEFLFDRDSMQKLMGNLLSNAVKFTPDGGTITIVASIYTDKTDNREKLYVAVKDSGKGIPEKDLDKIFERFYQSKSYQGYSGTGQSGTGIGLYLCKKIVELYEGSIIATNSHTGGAAIKFIIPVERQGNGGSTSESGEILLPEETHGHDETHDETARAKPSLLIVEDNSDMRQYIRSLLSEEYHVLEAANGAVGLTLTRQHLPDLIISDIMMPEMDGIEFCRAVKQHFNTSHIPVILLTAKSSIDTQIEGYQTGADAFLVKPFDEELLRAVLENLAEKKRRLQSSFAINMDVSVLDINEESQDKKFLDKALKVVKDNYTNPEFDVAEFIDEMGISRSLLHKKLTNLTGQSASRFVRTYRLNTARELIIKNRETHLMNISEIAYQVGFNDPKYFTRCFTKQFGTQPSMLMEERG